MRGQLCDPQAPWPRGGAGPAAGRVSRILPSTLSCLLSSRSGIFAAKAFPAPNHFPDSQHGGLARARTGLVELQRFNGLRSGVVRGAYWRLSSAPAAAEPTRRGIGKLERSFQLQDAGRNAMTAQLNLPLGNPMCDSTLFRMDLILVALPAASPIPRLPPTSPT